MRRLLRRERRGDLRKILFHLLLKESHNKIFKIKVLIKLRSKLKNQEKNHGKDLFLHLNISIQIEEVNCCHH